MNFANIFALFLRVFTLCRLFCSIPIFIKRPTNQIFGQSVIAYQKVSRRLLLLFFIVTQMRSEDNHRHEHCPENQISILSIVVTEHRQKQLI